MIYCLQYVWVIFTSLFELCCSRYSLVAYTSDFGTEGWAFNSWLGHFLKSTVNCNSQAIKGLCLRGCWGQITELYALTNISFITSRLTVLRRLKLRYLFSFTLTLQGCSCGHAWKGESGHRSEGWRRCWCMRSQEREMRTWWTWKC